MAQKKID